jgi:hypothetical protein
LEIDNKLKTLTSLLNINTEKRFRTEDLQNGIDTIWKTINTSRGKISDIIINRLSNIITKLAIVLDAYKANMIKFDNFKVYIEREKLINHLIEIGEIIITEKVLVQ